MPATSSVKPPIGLAQIFAPEAIILRLGDHTKEGIVTELVHHLVKLGRITEEDEKGVVQSILGREKLGTTALGNGIAFPHCRSSCTERFVGAIGLSQAGFPFDALDGELVYAVFLILAPLDSREQHFEVLGKISAIGADKGNRLQLRGCRSAERLHQFLQELDRR